MATYRFSKCPKCKQVINSEKNPQKEIGNPFGRCPYCGTIYRDSYVEEWATMSPAKRFKYFAYRAACISGVIAMVLFVIFAMVGVIDSVFWLIPIVFLVGFAIVFQIVKNSSIDAILESIKRTQDSEYLQLLKESGYNFYDIEQEYLDKLPREPIKSKEPKPETLDVCSLKIDNSSANITSENLYELAKKHESDNDVDKAVMLYMEASLKGHHEASLSLGYIYYYGKGPISADRNLALSYFRIAKKQGNKYAANIIEEIENEQQVN